MQSSCIFKVISKCELVNIATMIKLQKLAKSERFKRVTVITILLASFVFATFHSFAHNSFDHKHDSSCSVYVLEELYSSNDVVTVTFATTLFVIFYAIFYNATVSPLYTRNYFNVRAPPVSHF